MSPPLNNEHLKKSAESDEHQDLEPQMRPVNHPAKGMRAAVDLCAEALIQAMVNARTF